LSDVEGLLLLLPIEEIVPRNWSEAFPRLKSLKQPQTRRGLNPRSDTVTVDHYEQRQSEREPAKMAERETSGAPNTAGGVPVLEAGAEAGTGIGNMWGSEFEDGHKETVYEDAQEGKNPCL
jgi:hypothetical protein